MSRNKKSPTGDPRNFQGLTPRDFQALNKEHGGQTTYRGIGKILGWWYAWGAERDLEPIEDFREQTQLFVTAEAEASRRARKIVFADVPDSELKKFTDEEKYKLLSEHMDKTRELTRDILHEQGYIIAPIPFTVTVDPETLEMEQGDWFKRPAQKYVPGYAKALFKRCGKSTLSWRDFEKHYIELLKAEHGSTGALWMFSMMPAQAVDRAARGFPGWDFPLNDAPTFRDDNSKHTVTYFADGLSLEALREGVMELNPRTADIWRLCTAAILEAWGEGEKEPPRVWVDARQLCDAMGFKKHHKGGHDPRNVAIAARGLVDLERFYITIPYGAKQYPENARTGKRKATTVEARAQHRVMAVMAKEEARQLFDEEWLPLRWLVTAGEWIKAYPREQFAPLFRALVELPCTHTPDLWAKAIGTELVWQYRQNGGETKVQYVKTMLKQAGVLEDGEKDKNKKRVRDNFEKALDKLQKYDVCKAWEYDGGDIDKVEATTRGWFDLWLDCRVVVTPPQEVTKALAATVKRKNQHRRRR